ncbi:cystine ABC transporter permease [Salmonella enterica]|nr:cystine ABC transporter permease [Salmonella enterica]
MNSLYTAEGVMDKHSLWQRYVPLVRHEALRLQVRLPASVELDDLLQAGGIGLLNAVDRYDALQGTAFTTYAVQRIRGAMLDELRSRDWVPRSVRRNAREVAQAMGQLEQELGRNATETEVAERLGIPVAEYRQMLLDTNNSQLFSYDEWREEHGDSIELVTEEHQQENPLHQLLEGDLRQRVMDAIESLPYLLKGAVFTLQLSIGGMFFGLLLGFVLALMRMSPLWPVRWLARFYISIFRGTPLIAQLFMIYYGLPQFGIELDPIPAAMIGLSLNTAAYTSETLRAAISAIDKGQWEAAASIGMTPWQTLRRAILPQAARVALPPLSNSFISLVKDTSLAATIQVPELFRQAQLITSRTLEVFTMYLAASLIYWVMATVLSALQNYFENQLNRQEREPK